MSNNEIWATCGDCGTELKQSDKLCPKCGSAKKAYRREASVVIEPKIVETRVKQKRQGYRGFMKNMISRWKRSRDPKLKGRLGEEVEEELVIDKEKAWKDHIVKDARTGEILHEEHRHLGEDNKGVKNSRKILSKFRNWWRPFLWVIIASALTYYFTPFLPTPPWDRPISPITTSSLSPNPLVNTDDVQTVIVTVTPDFKPPYSNEVALTIQNPNRYECYMVLELKASEGFKFLPISSSLPENFGIEQGYEYKDIMKLYIKDFPPRFSYDFSLPVYTLNPDTFGGTENINTRDLEVLKEQ